MKNRVKKLFATILVGCLLLESGTIKSEAFSSGETLGFYNKGEYKNFAIGENTDLNQKVGAVATSLFGTIETSYQDENSNTYNFTGWYGYYYNQSSYTETTFDNVSLSSIPSPDYFVSGWKQEIPIFVDGLSQGYRPVGTSYTVPDINYVGYTVDFIKLNENEKVVTSGQVIDIPAKTDESVPKSNYRIILDTSSETGYFYNKNSIDIVSYLRPVAGNYLVQITDKTGRQLAINQDPVLITAESKLYSSDGRYCVLGSDISDIIEKIGVGEDASSGSYVSYDNNSKMVWCNPITLTESDLKRVLNIKIDSNGDGTFNFEKELTDYTSYNGKSLNELISELPSAPEKSTDGKGEFSHWEYAYTSDFTKKGTSVKLEEIPILDYDNDNTYTSLYIRPVFKGTYTFDPNGGQFESGESSVTKLLGETANLSINLTREGYHFLGWAENSEANIPDENFNPSSFTITDDKTYYAVWKKKTYNLLWMNDDVIHKEQKNVPYGDTVSIPENNPAKAGHDFTGWTGYDSTFIPELENGSFSMPDVDVDEVYIYAGWKENSYQLSYDLDIPKNSNYTGDALEPIKVSYFDIDDHTIVLSNPALTNIVGYQFAGWTLGGTDYDYDANNPVSCPLPATRNESSGGTWSDIGIWSITATARWNPVYHTVTYDSDGGEAVTDSQKYQDGIDEVTVKGSSKEGYELSGWETISITGKKETYKQGSQFKMPQNDVAFKALWTKAYNDPNGSGQYYLWGGHAYKLSGSTKVSGDPNSYASGISFYVKENGYYTFE